MTATEDQQTGQSTVHLPRIAIKFCTQCKWNLRAAYYAQELLQTFSTTIGEIALIPVTGGIFTVTLYHNNNESISAEQPTNQITNPDQANNRITETLLWDRKQESGFPETKELKNRVRNILEPKRDLGHIDRSLKKGSTTAGAATATTTMTAKEKENGSGKDRESKAVSVAPTSTSTSMSADQVAGGESNAESKGMSRKENEGDDGVNVSGNSTGIESVEDAKMKECEDCK